MRFLLVMFILLANGAYANIAVEQLNQLLAKKEQAKGAPSSASPLLNELTNNYRFLFIYRSDCPHCHKFAPVLLDFANHFNITIDAYSVDGKPLPGLTAKTLTPELFQTFYLGGGFKTAVPALFLVNRHTMQAYAVLFGEASPYQLARRVQELMQHIAEKFHD
jgi:type-F conjugative transfer system pilin assembly thiol-disulfide isomerase TrbB